MSRTMSPQRRRIVAVAGSAAAMGGVVPILAHGHPYFAGVIISLMFLAFVYIGLELAKLKRTGDCR